MPPFLLAMFASKTGIITTLIVLLFLTLGGYYYWSQQEIKTLKENNATIQIELNKQCELVKRMEDDIKKVTKERLDYINKVSTLDSKTKKLEAMLSDNSKPLAEEVKKKSAKVVGGRISESVRSILECFEQLTDSKISSSNDCTISELNS